MNYYILSRHTQGDNCLWWRDNNAGYTTDLNFAGLYTQRQVDAQRDYYDNHDETWAIPELEVIKASSRTVDSSFFFARKRAADEAAEGRVTK